MRRLAALAVAAALALAGCRAAPPPAPALPGAVTDARGALRRLDERDRATGTLTVLFRMKVAAPGAAEQTLRGAVAIERPDRLRLQVFSFGAMTVYDYVVSGDRWRVRRPLDGADATGRFRDGPPPGTAGFGADLRPLFLAGSPSSAEVRDLGAAFLVRTEAGEEGREIEIEKATGRIAGETVTERGRVRLRIRYGDERPVGGVALPFAIGVEAPAESVRLDIEVERYRRNEPLTPGIFDF